MPRILSPAAAQSVLAANTSEVWVAALRITHPSMEPIRIVNDSIPMVRADGMYLPWAFEVSLPDDNQDANPNVTLTIDNVDLEIANKIRTLEGDPPKCTFEVLLVSQPDRVEVGPFDFSILDASIDMTTIEVKLGYEEDFLNQSVPAQIYSPANSPGLFV